MTLEEFAVESARLAHAMQSGVAAEMNVPGRERATEPKHLRVGVNQALVEIGAVARLLIGKGLVTEQEYFEAILHAQRAEVAKYERSLSEHYGNNVTLG